MRPACSTRLLTVPRHSIWPRLLFLGCGKSAVEKVSGAPTEGEQGSATAPHSRLGTMRLGRCSVAKKPTPMVVLQRLNGGYHVKHLRQKPREPSRNFLR